LYAHYGIFGWLLVRSVDTLDLVC